MADMTFSELSNQLYEQAIGLQKHAKHRNYLWELAEGNADTPLLELTTDGETVVETDMYELTTDVKETIIYGLIENAEKRSFALWKGILETAKKAVAMIETVEKGQRSKEDDD